MGRLGIMFFGACLGPFFWLSAPVPLVALSMLADQRQWETSAACAGRQSCTQGALSSVDLMGALGTITCVCFSDLDASWLVSIALACCCLFRSHIQLIRSWYLSTFNVFASTARLSFDKNICRSYSVCLLFLENFVIIRSALTFLRKSSWLFTAVKI